MTQGKLSKEVERPSSRLTSPLIVAKSPQVSPHIGPQAGLEQGGKLQAMPLDEVGYDLKDGARYHGSPSVGPESMASPVVERDQPAYIIPTTPSPFLSSSFAPMAPPFGTTYGGLNIGDMGALPEAATGQEDIGADEFLGGQDDDQFTQQGMQLLPGLSGGGCSFGRGNWGGWGQAQTQPGQAPQSQTGPQGGQQNQSQGQNQNQNQNQGRGNQGSHMAPGYMREGSAVAAAMNKASKDPPYELEPFDDPPSTGPARGMGNRAGGNNNNQLNHNNHNNHHNNLHNNHHNNHNNHGHNGGCGRGGGGHCSDGYGPCGGCGGCGCGGCFIPCGGGCCGCLGCMGCGFGPGCGGCCSGCGGCGGCGGMGGCMGGCMGGMGGGGGGGGGGGCGGGGCHNGGSSNSNNMGNGGGQQRQQQQQQQRGNQAHSQNQQPNQQQQQQQNRDGNNNNNKRDRRNNQNTQQGNNGNNNNNNGKNDRQGGRGGFDRGDQEEGYSRQERAREQHHHDEGATGTGGEEYTTVMLRNIPNKYTREMLINQLNLEFNGKYDFMYLPIDFKNKCNVGYCFINFREPAVCEHFIKKFHGVDVRKCLPGLNSKKIVEVTPARVQGLTENVRRLKNSPVMNQLQDHPEWMPLLFGKDGEEEPFPMPDTPLPPIKARGRNREGGKADGA